MNLRPYNAETHTSVGARFIPKAGNPLSSKLDVELTLAPELPSNTSAFNPDIHHRRSIRLHGYDYSQAGAYFITLCTQKRGCLFGAVVGDSMRLNDVGRLVQNIWDALPDHYAGVTLDAFVVMSNHIHGILMLNDVGAQFTAEGSLRSGGAPTGVPLAGAAPDNDDGAMNRNKVRQSAIEQARCRIDTAPTIGEIIRAFKARCTHGINQLRGVQGLSIWQRNYFEHIIRNESSLQEIREYITNNPAQWAIDRENPDVVGARFIAPLQIRKIPGYEAYFFAR